MEWIMTIRILVMDARAALRASDILQHRRRIVRSENVRGSIILSIVRNGYLTYLRG